MSDATNDTTPPTIEVCIDPGGDQPSVVILRDGKIWSDDPQKPEHDWDAHFVTAHEYRFGL